MEIMGILLEIQYFGECCYHSPDFSVGVDRNSGVPAQAWGVCLLLWGKYLCHYQFQVANMETSNVQLEKICSPTPGYLQ